MNKVILTFHGRTESVPVEPNEDTSSFLQTLCNVFGFKAQGDMICIKSVETKRIYSIAEVVKNPSLFASNAGTIVVGPLSPISMINQLTTSEQLFQYVIGNCGLGTFSYYDYFTLRVLYNMQPSALTAADNLLLDNNYEDLNKHLHAIINQVRNSMPIKMGVVRLITVNMQMNKEISVAHANILLSLVQQEDGLICAAYQEFEKTANLANFKQALLQVLLLTVRPDNIDIEKRKQAQAIQEKNRGSWRQSSQMLNLTAVFEQMNEMELLIYTVYELGILTEPQTHFVIQKLSEDPMLLFNFMAAANENIASLCDFSLYSKFVSDPEDSELPHTPTIHQEEYPSELITFELLRMQKAGLLSNEEYAQLYKRCQNDSPAVKHCYSLYSKEQHAFQKELQRCYRLYEALRNAKLTLDQQGHQHILEQLEKEELLNASEIQWVKEQYVGGEEVVVQAFKLCKECGDLKGLADMLRSLMQLRRRYEEQNEAQQYLAMLVDEMRKEEYVTEQQAILLHLMVREGQKSVVELYNEYKKSNDFEGLLDALICLVQSPVTQDEAEEVEEDEEDDLEIPSRETVFEVLRGLNGKLTDNEIATAILLVQYGDGDIIYSIAEYLRDKEESQLLTQLHTQIHAEVTKKYSVVLNWLQCLEGLSSEDQVLFEHGVYSLNQDLVTVLLGCQSPKDALTLLPCLRNIQI